MRRVLITLPILLFCLLLVINNIEYGVVVIGEGNEPWYSAYTSIVFIVCSMFFYPITVLSSVLGLKILGVTSFVLYFLYSVVISVVVHKYWPINKFT